MFHSSENLQTLFLSSMSDKDFPSDPEPVNLLGSGSDLLSLSGPNFSPCFSVSKRFYPFDFLGLKSMLLSLICRNDSGFTANVFLTTVAGTDGESIFHFCSEFHSF